jgi:hypothetical protein
MRKLLSVLAVAVLCVSGAVGCGAAVEPETGDSLVSEGQELKACLNDGTMAGACAYPDTCVGGTCRRQCSNTGTCASGQQCCLGYVYSDGSVMSPYCLSTTQECYLP